MNLSVLGLGNMAKAIIGGIKKNYSGDIKIVGADPLEEARTYAKETLGVETFSDNNEAVKNADVILLAVKPQYAAQVLSGIKDSVKEETVIISIVAGKSIEWLEKNLGKPAKIVRCMPNTPALINESCTGVCRNETVSDEEFARACEIVRAFGRAIDVPESMMDAVCGVSGSAPAYVFMFIEAMADAAVYEGMPRAKAYEFAAMAVMGSAKLMLETGKHPGELKDMVTSPAGTTIEAVKVLEDQNFRGTVMDAVIAATEKSKQL